MSSIKTDKTLNEKGVLNTTIGKQILDDFKGKCKETGIPMNVILEIFMTQFCNDDFQLTFKNSNKLEFLLND